MVLTMDLTAYATARLGRKPKKALFENSLFRITGLEKLYYRDQIEGR